MDHLFLERMKQILSEDDYLKFVKSLDEDNIRGLLLNRKYMNDEAFSKLEKSFSLAKISNIVGAYRTDNKYKFGFDPLHHAGAYYITDPSAMLPPISIGKKDNIHLILDLCAAPGGKTIGLANMYPDAVIISNEIEYKRAKILYQNIERMGLSNVIITNNKPEDFLPYKGMFDLVLVDAPCSGEGMFRKYQEAIDNWSIENINACAKRDKEIVDVAMALIKEKGTLIYSTCTFAPEEDEEIAQYILKNGFESIDVKDEYKQYLTKTDVDYGYKIYPHNNFGEGQFMASFINQNSLNPATLHQLKFAHNKLFDEFILKNLNVKIDNYIIEDNVIFYCPTNIDFEKLKILNYGVKLGYIDNKIFKPDHNFFKSFGLLFKNQLKLENDDPRLAKYLRGEQIEGDVSDGYGIILALGVPLGGFKAKNGILNNHYPKILRNF